MSQVDPFVYPATPSVIRNDRELVNYFQYLERFLHDLWLRTGGGDDAISNQAIREAYPWNLLEPTGRDANKHVLTVTGSTTLTGYEDVVIVTAACTVTLNPTPRTGEQVHIKRVTTGTVVVSSSLFIDGSTTYTMALNYEGIDLLYTDSGWLII